MGKVIVLLILGVILIAGLWFWNISKTATPTKSTFTLSLKEEAKIIYDFYTEAGVHKRHEYLISLNSVDVFLGEAEFNLTEIYTSSPNQAISKTFNLTLGEQFTWFVTQEGGTFFKLIKLENTTITLETWFEIGEPHPLGPLPPKSVAEMGEES